MAPLKRPTCFGSAFLTVYSFFSWANIWGRAVCSDSRPAPLRWAREETHGAYPNVSDRRHVAFFCASFFQKTKAPARNAAPRDIAFSWACSSHNIKAPARNATPRDIAFSWACFSQKTKAPARNADPRHIAFFLGMLFPRKTGAPARNGNPRDIVFSGRVFLEKQKPLLGTPTRET